MTYEEIETYEQVITTWWMGGCIASCEYEPYTTDNNVQHAKMQVVQQTVGKEKLTTIKREFVAY